MSSWGQQREQTVGRVAGVFDNPPGFPCTPPGVDVLEGGKLTSNNVADSSHEEFYKLLNHFSHYTYHYMFFNYTIIIDRILDII